MTPFNLKLTDHVGSQCDSREDWMYGNCSGTPSATVHNRKLHKLQEAMEKAGVSGSVKGVRVSIGHGNEFRGDHALGVSIWIEEGSEAQVEGDCYFTDKAWGCTGGYARLRIRGELMFDSEA